LSTQDGELVATGVKGAKFALLDVLDGEDWMYGIRTYHNHFKGAMPGRVFLINGLSLFYVEIELVSFVFRKAANYLGQLMAGVFRSCCLDADYYETIPEERITCGKICENENNCIELLSGEFNRTKVSKDHHTYLRPEEVMFCYKPCDATVAYEGSGKIIRLFYSSTVVKKDSRLMACAAFLKFARSVKINNEATIATMLLYLVASSEFARRIFLEICSLSIDEGEFFIMLKEEGTASKVLQHYRRSDLVNIFELNVLVNRVVTEMDWDAEKEKRVDSKVYVTNSRDIYERSKTIFMVGRSEGKTPYKQEWDDYWKARWARTPSGSYFASSVELKEKGKVIPAKFRNKKSVLSSIKNLKIGTILNMEPHLMAKTSIKYEWGKTRAIYGCNVENFLLTDFSFGGAEETLPGYFPVGSRANDNYVKNAVSRMSNAIPLCYDYDDFNSQHSIHSQQAVLKAWVDVYRDILSDDQVKAALWSIKALKNMSAKFGDEEVFSKVNGTLFSGWRLTSFCNTVLNRVYLEQAGLLELTTYSLHNGDDVLASVEWFTQGVDLIHTAEGLGIRAQKNKLNFGSIGEFLRVDGLAVDKTGAQYITRALSTMVHGRIESMQVSTMRNGLEANITRVNEAISRGAEAGLMIRILGRINKVLSKIFESDDSVCELYGQLHPVQGGINGFGRVGQQRIIEVKIGYEDLEAKEVSARTETGAQDYINLLAQQLGVDLDKVDRSMIRESNLSMNKVFKTSLSVTREDRKLIQAHRMIYGAWKNDKSMGPINKARLVGLSMITTMVDRANDVFRYIRKLENPLEYITLVY